jgi:hypothetical protein
VAFERAKTAKKNGKMDYWKLLTPVIKWNHEMDPPVPEVKYQCPMGCYLTVTNVSQSAGRHFAVIDGKLACKKRTSDQSLGGAFLDFSFPAAKLPRRI